MRLKTRFLAEQVNNEGKVTAEGVHKALRSADCNGTATLDVSQSIFSEAMEIAYPSPILSMTFKWTGDAAQIQRRLHVRHGLDGDAELIEALVK